MPCNRLQTKELTLPLRSFYKTKKMSNKQTHFLPDWRQLCQAALFETDAVKLLERIAHARNPFLTASKTVIRNLRMANNTICEML